MKIIKGKRIKPMALLVYGLHGLGKTQFGVESEKPIFIGSEENDEIETDRFPRIKQWDDLKNQLQYLLTEKHEYKTVVIDTMDALEQVAQDEILKKEKGKTMATALGGYGKAYAEMYDMFLEIREKYLVRLRDEVGMNIIILAHAEKSKDTDEFTLTTYNTYSTAMHDKVKPIFQDWASAILFITWKNHKVEGKDGKERAIGQGQRIILTEERPSHIAKNRFELPYEIEFEKNVSYKEIATMIKNYYSDSKAFEKPKVEINPESKELQDEISDIMKRIEDDEIKDRVKLSIARADGDVNELKRIKTKAEKLAK